MPAYKLISFTRSISSPRNNGYKFVWDFSTSQGNGTISALALTHKYGGIGYFGDTYNMSNKLLQMKEVQESIQAQGAEPQAMSVADFDKFFDTDFKHSKAVVESSGATIN